MKIIVKALAVWGCIATIPFILLLVAYLDSEGIVMFRRNSATDYYYPVDLEAMKLPQWDLTNAIPLSPDTAVKAAMRFASEKHPDVVNWETHSILLEQNGDDGIWHYTINLSDLRPGGHASEGVKVLMDGSIWKPTNQMRKQ